MYSSFKSLNFTIYLMHFSIQNCTSGNNILFRLVKLLQLTRMWKLMKLHNVLRCGHSLECSSWQAWPGISRNKLVWITLIGIWACWKLCAHHTENVCTHQQGRGCLGFERRINEGYQVYAGVVPPCPLPRLRLLDGKAAANRKHQGAKVGWKCGAEIL